MKRFFKRVADLFFVLLPHINISMALFMLTLLVTDFFNRAMAFINNNITKGMLFVFCILILTEAIHDVIQHRKK